MSFAEYAELDATELARRVRVGDVSPRELVEAARHRIEALNPRLNAFVYEAFEEARVAAERELPEGPFRGVPFALKDLTAEARDVPLANGSRFTAGYVPNRDNELVHRLRRAGFILLGRTNTPELGIMGVTESCHWGPARNPWNTAHTPGGSSGGAAAAVAARMLPAAHGNDGGGSIRIPASACGVFGLKPTRARNPLGPDLGDGWFGLIVEHVLSLSVRDSAAILDATRGPDLGAPYHVPHPERPFTQELEREPGKLRVAFTTTPLFGRETHADCVAATHDAAKLCEQLGHHVYEAHPPLDRLRLRKLYYELVSAGVALDLRGMVEQMGREPRFEELEPLTWAARMGGQALSAEQLAVAIRHMHVASRRVAAFFEEHDVLLTPTMAQPPARIGAFSGLSKPEQLGVRMLHKHPPAGVVGRMLDRLAEEDPQMDAISNTMLFNMTGQPAMSVPLFWNAHDLPIGVQFAGRFGNEATLFRLAAQLENARPWASRKPRDV